MLYKWNNKFCWEKLKILNSKKYKKARTQINPCSLTHEEAEELVPDNP